MSRIGKKPIAIPAGVTITCQRQQVEVKGPKGSLNWVLPEVIEMQVEDGVATLTRANDERQSKALHGLARALVANMVVGVSQGYEKHLEVRGVGYRAELSGQTLLLNVGFSHQVKYQLLPEVEVEVGKSFNVGPVPVTPLVVRGIDKVKVGRVAAEIRACRKPEPYQGKGIRYKDEAVQIKVGKRNV